MHAYLAYTMKFPINNVERLIDGENVRKCVPINESFKSWSLAAVLEMSTKYSRTQWEQLSPGGLQDSIVRKMCPLKLIVSKLEPCHRLEMSAMCRTQWEQFSPRGCKTRSILACNVRLSKTLSRCSYFFLEKNVQQQQHKSCHR